jgi:uncharacterized repeat protein (TIGR01451 family)
MKTTTFTKTLLSVAVLAATASNVWAAGTAAGTDIDNKATISYSVGGTNQTPIESSEAGNSNPGTNNGSPTTFKVDKKIDLLVTSGTGVNVVPGTTAQSITFTLKNEGNSTESFNMTPSQVASGDQFDTTNCQVVSPTLPVSLTADQTKSVTVNCDIPPSDAIVKNGATSKVDLMAQAQGVTETTGAESANTVDVVFADDTGTATDGANRNAKHSATNTYTVNTADLTVKKTSAVTQDPFNGTTNPKRIPGATIEYTITVSNAAGAATASGINITDTVPADLENITATVTGGTSTNATVAGNNVSTTPFDLAAGETATLTITATVK